jgi:hypothetical protein
MRDSGDWQNRYLPQQQGYPQQYPQQPYPPYYPPPYYYPYQPPKNDDGKIIAIVLAVVLIFTVLPTVMSAVFFFLVAPSGPNIPYGPYTGAPNGSFATINPDNKTSATATFDRFYEDPPPTRMEVILENESGFSGRYAFTSDDDGPLTHIEGDYMGRITYEDIDDDRDLNIGDYLILDGLSPDTNYTLTLIWIETGETIDRRSFTTPAG